EIVEMRHDQGGEFFGTCARLALVFYADDGKFGDARAFQVMNLAILWMNILTRSQNDHILCSPATIELASAVATAESPGMQPATVRKGSLRGVGVVVVAPENNAATDGRLADAILVGVVNADLDALHGFADRAGDIVMFEGRGRSTAGLRQAVTLQDREAEI